MKVVAVNGSPRSQGNTYTAIRMMTDVLESQGIETEILQLGNQPISGCTVCGGCRKDPEGMCVLPGDHLRDYVKKMLEADGIILGSPVYYGAIAGGMKCFLDRAFYASAGQFRHKVGYAVTAVRRAGGVAAFQQLCSYFNLAEMIIAPTTYWGIGYGALPGQVQQDTEGEDTMRLAAMNMAMAPSHAGSHSGFPPCPSKN